MGNQFAITGVLLAAILLSVTVANAATPIYYWDTNGTDDGPGNPPSGVWDNNTPNWTTDPGGDAETFAYPGRAHVVFAATGGAEWDETSDYTVDVDGIVQLSNIYFQDGNCTMTNDYGYLDKNTPYIWVGNDGQTATVYSSFASAAGTTNGITKYGYGTLVLGGTNTYSGPTTIEGGTLRLGAPQVLPPASALVLAGGDTRTDDPLGNSGYSTGSTTFDAGGYSQTLGPLSLTGPYTSLLHAIDFGNGASALAFADSHSQNWNGITLRIANYTPGVDSLRFGTNSAGLTATQLGLIRFVDYLDVPGRIDSKGYVTPVPGPSLSVSLTEAGGVMLNWNAIVGRTYNIQCKTNLNQPSWNSDFTTDVVATNAMTSFSDTFNPSNRRFYRVGLRPVSVGD